MIKDDGLKPIFNPKNNNEDLISVKAVKNSGIVYFNSHLIIIIIDTFHERNLKKDI